MADNKVVATVGAETSSLSSSSSEPSESRLSGSSSSCSSISSTCSVREEKSVRKGIVTNTTRKSCDVCAKAKKKCDGSSPCASCSRWGMVCVYSKKLKPGPHGAHKRSKEGLPLPSGKKAKFSHDISDSSDYCGNVLKSQMPSLPLPGGSSSFFSKAMYSPDIKTQQAMASQYKSRNPSPPTDIPFQSIAQLDGNPGITGSTLFGQRETFFVQLHLHLANSNVPICNMNILSEGIENIMSCKGKLQFPSSRSSAVVALTWCACALGASTMQNDIAMQFYLQYAVESLRNTFEDASDIVARAFLALEIVNHVFANPPFSATDSSSFSSRKSYVMGRYRAIGQAILDSIQIQEVQDETRLLLVYCSLLERTFVRSSLLSKHADTAGSLSIEYFEEFDCVQKGLSAGIDMRLLLSAYCNKASLEWIMRLRNAMQSTVKLTNQPFSGVCDVSWKIPQIEHLKRLATGLTYLSMLGESCHTEPVTFIYLQVVVGLHRIQVGMISIALEEFSKLANFIIMRPLLLFCPQMWHCVHTVLCILYQYKDSDVAVTVDFNGMRQPIVNSTALQYLGRLLVRGMQRLCLFTAPDHHNSIEYCSANLRIPCPQAFLLHNADLSVLKEMLLIQAPHIALHNQVRDDSSFNDKFSKASGPTMAGNKLICSAKISTANDVELHSLPLSTISTDSLDKATLLKSPLLCLADIAADRLMLSDHETSPSNFLAPDNGEDCANDKDCSLFVKLAKQNSSAQHKVPGYLVVLSEMNLDQIADVLNLRAHCGYWTPRNYQYHEQRSTFTIVYDTHVHADGDSLMVHCLKFTH